MNKTIQKKKIEKNNVLSTILDSGKTQNNSGNPIGYQVQSFHSKIDIH